MKERFELPEDKNEKIRQDKLERFKKLRGFIDEIPPFLLLPHHGNYHRYKCRVGFFCAVRNDIDQLIYEGAISDPQLTEEGNKFIKYLETEHPLEKNNPLGPEFTTEADINYVNRILDMFITNFSQE